MIKGTFALLAGIMLAGCASTKPDPPTDQELLSGWINTNYEVACEAVGVEGTQVLTIWTFGRDMEDAMSSARLNAVQALLFKGVNSNVCVVPALIQKDVDEQAFNWLKEFFTLGGEYLNYVNQSGDVPIDMIRSGRLVKVSSVVVVDRNRLRERLRQNGIITGFGDEFIRK